MELKPLYRIGNSILVGLKEDYQTNVVEDGLVIQIDLERKEITNTPWSGQKKLKFGYYEPISDNEIEKVIEDILSSFDVNQIKEMEDLLLHPSKEAVESLIWKPERLRQI